MTSSLKPRKQLILFAVALTLITATGIWAYYQIISLLEEQEVITKPGVYKPEILSITYTLGKIEFKNDAIIAIPTTVYISEIFPVTVFNFTIFFDKIFNSTKTTIVLYIQSLDEKDWPVIIWPCYSGTPTWYPVYLYVEKGKTYKVVIKYPGTIETCLKTITYIYREREFIKTIKSPLNSIRFQGYGKIKIYNMTIIIKE